ncbi:MAG: hypothetical protein EP343_23715 [Deltaproteobacteria bacterium]|nr:MAG: hypothetical protein EP343_23715 [Deltaproteobacteria bacterium]
MPLPTSRYLPYMRIIGCALVVGCFLPLSAWGKPTPPPKRNWKHDIAQTCKTKGSAVKSAKPYVLQKAGKTAGFALGHVKKATKGANTSLVWLSYRRCKTGWCPLRCLTLQTVRCSAQPKPGCVFQYRGVRLIDLNAASTDVAPESGSWYGTTVQEPKQTAQWPLLFVQGQTNWGTGDKQRTQTKTTLISLQQAQHPRVLNTLVTKKQWPPILIAGRKQDPIGNRMRLIQFRRQPYQPVQMTTIERPIPSPFDRCCKPKDTYQNYQLSTQGFEKVFAL